MKVTIARLRSNVTYTGFNNHTLDPYFYCLVNWMKSRPDLEFQTYNMSFDAKQKPKRTLQESDYWIIPSEAEFRYHGELQMNPKDLETSQKYMDELKPYIEGKNIIMLRSDRADTEELYRNETFKGVNIASFTTIDEIDFSGNIHGLRYHFVSKMHNFLTDSCEPKNDFAYWGRMKTDANDRQKFIRKLYRDKDLTQILIGGFPSGVIRDYKWVRDWNKLFAILKDARCTVCFNWKDPTATTSRYVESLAVGLIPFVWGEYDINNTYRISDWQRVNSFEEFKTKCLTLREGYDTLLKEIRENYFLVLMSRDDYKKQFNEMMNSRI